VHDDSLIFGLTTVPDGKIFQNSSTSKKEQATFKKYFL